MRVEPRELRDADDAAQAETLAAAIAAALAAALTRRPAASLVVSGGGTPRAMYTQLALHKLDWPRVQITLADERWVATDDEASNERMVRESLLRDGAAGARFIGLKNDAATPAQGVATAWSALGAMSRPFDAVVLGMGDDGHVASLFPGSAELAAGLDVRSPPGCIAVQSQAVSHARLSLNLAALLQSRRVFVQIIGAQKWQAYERARRAGPVAAMPIRAILRQSAVPVDVYWCPDPPAHSAAAKACAASARDIE